MPSAFPFQQTSSSTLPRTFLKKASRLAALAAGALAGWGGSSVAQVPVIAPVTAVGTTVTVPVTVVMNTAATGAVTTAVTAGTPNADFTLPQGAACPANAAAGSVCTLNVQFKPLYPGLRQGAVLVTSSDGSQVFGSTLINGSATGSLAVLTPGQVFTVAGDGELLYKGDNVPAHNTSIYLPQGVTSDSAGNLFISDTNNNRIRRVDYTSGLIYTVAGGTNSGYAGDGGQAFNATLSQPSGIVMDGAGNLFFSDSGNNVIRRIDAVTKVITTVAATKGVLSGPRGLVFDGFGNLFIADTGNNVIRKLSAADGSLTVVAGTGMATYNGDGQLATAAALSTPWNVAIGPDGLLYIADLGNSLVRKVNAAGIISSVAGNGTRGFSGDGGGAITAELNDPAAVAFDPAGNLYIADSGNNRVRRVDGTGTIATLTGTNITQFLGDYGPANEASFYAPYALFFDKGGNLFISDMLHNRIREISATPTYQSYPDIRVGKVSAPQIQGLENDGNDALVFGTPVLVNGKLDAATTTCNFAGTLLPDSNCDLGIEFAPTTVGTNVTGSVTLPSNAGNSPTVVGLQGNVLSVEPVTVTLTSNVNPSMVGAAVTFTATVASDDPNVSGPVTFLDGTTAICSNINISNGVATCTTSTLALGQHTMTASYAGDNNNEAKVSAPLTQTVQQAATVTLAATPNPATVTATVTLTATLAAPSGTPTGTVVFFDGTTALTGNVAVSNGVATFTTSQLAPGTHTLTVQYAGDTNDAAATSNAVSEVVNQTNTTTTLSTSDANVVVGTSVTFTAMVSSANGTAPTGTVSFADGTTTLGSVSVTASGTNATASLPYTALAPGAHAIVATYTGDRNDATSSSTPLVQTVNQIPTATTLASDTSSPNAGATVHLTATVAISGSAAADGAITGSVTFMAGTVNLGTASVNANGQATLAVILPAGSQSLTASYGGNTNYAASTSSALVETVNTTTTTTTLSSSASSSLAGKPVTFTAVVNSSTGTPTGSVTFKDGATTLGVSPLNSGVATFTTTSLSVSSHSITATYSGDTNYLTSQSTPVADVVSLGTTSVTLAGPARADVATTVMLTGALTSNGVTPTGPLTLLDGGTAIGTQNASASGSFSFSTSALAIGTHMLTVSYGGDADNAGSVSPALTLVVQQASTTTSLASSANPSTLGQSLTLTASVTSSGAGISGTVAFMDGTTVLGSSPLVNGTASLSTSSLAFGPHSLTAVYSGDTNHATSTSTTLVEQVVQAATASLTSSVNPATAGTNVVFTARLAPVGSLVPTGSVTFLDGTATLGTAALDGTGAATFATAALAVGSHTISVRYAGDTNFASSSAALIETVRNSDTTIALTASANPVTYGAALNLVATITTNGGVATGTVTFTDGSTTIGSALLNGSGVATLTISTLAPGVHTVVANYAGDGKASASASTPLTVTVLQATTTTVASSANPAQTLSAVTLTATVKNSVGAATGTVTFTDGATQLGTVTLGATGVVTLTVPQLSAGSHAITASYSGDGSDFPSTGTLTENVQLRPTTTSLSSTQTDPSQPQQVTLIGVVHYTGPNAATGTVVFTSGGNTLGTAPIDATGVATLVITLAANATEQVVATYNGDSAYDKSSSAATAVSGGTPTQFTMTLSPAAITLQSKQHASTTLTVTSLKGFGDTLEFGCLGQPYASTCTFSQTQMQLNANGTGTVTLTIDTGNPLGGGAAASALGGTGRTLLLSLPLLVLLSFALLRNGRRGKLPTLLLAGIALLLTLGATGCAGISTSGTPPGTYTFFVTAQGKGTGATQSQTMTLTVTQ